MAFNSPFPASRSHGVPVWPQIRVRSRLRIACVWRYLGVCIGQGLDQFRAPQREEPCLQSAISPWFCTCTAESPTRQSTVVAECQGHLAVPKSAIERCKITEVGDQNKPKGASAKSRHRTSRKFCYSPSGKWTEFVGYDGFYAGFRNAIARYRFSCGYLLLRVPQTPIPGVYGSFN